MRSTVNRKLAAVREKLASDVAAFLANGGEIYDVQPCDNRWYKDKGNVQRASLTIMAAQSRHRWRPKRGKRSA